MVKVFVSRRQAAYFGTLLICVVGFLLMGSVALLHGERAVMAECLALALASIGAFYLMGGVLRIREIPKFSSDLSTWIRVQTTELNLKLTSASDFELVEDELKVSIVIGSHVLQLTRDCSGYKALVPLLRAWKRDLRMPPEPAD